MNVIFFNFQKNKIWENDLPEDPVLQNIKVSVLGRRDMKQDRNLDLHKEIKSSGNCSNEGKYKELV